MKSRLGPRELKNPLGFTKFEYNSVDEAEKAIEATQEVEMDEGDSAAAALEGLAVSNVNPSGGAIGKFNKKSKKKKKNKPKFWIKIIFRTWLSLSISQFIFFNEIHLVWLKTPMVGKMHIAYTYMIKVRSDWNMSHKFWKYKKQK